MGKMAAAFLLVFTGMIAVPFGSVLAGYYLYQLPDGSRMITDRPILDNAYSLVRASRDVKGMGRYAANRYKKYNTNKNHRRYDVLIRKTASQYDVDVALVKAIIHAESYFNPNATSKKGASGLMQLMPETARQYGLYDLYNPQQNIQAGVKYLRYLLDKYPYQLKNAIAAYNAGERVVNFYKGIPPYPETRNYVEKVLNYQAFYRH